jgi:type I restriction enzyme S subunit
MKQLYTGVAIKNISKTNIEGIKIPIPSIERQDGIVKYLDFIYEKANKTSYEKIAELKRLNEFCLNNQKIFGENEVKTLGEVCEFQNGYSFKSSDYEKQNETNIGILQIKSIQSGVVDENKITEYIPESSKYKLFEIHKGDLLIALSGATTGKIGIYNLKQKSYLNQRVGKINAKKGISQKYIYYWYLCNDIDVKILGLAQGTAQPNISTGDISNIKIPIPSLERQKEIVEYCENNYLLIKQLEKEIESNKKQATQFMATIIKSPEQCEDN